MTEPGVPPESRTTPFGYNGKAIDEIAKRSGVNARATTGDATE